MLPIVLVTPLNLTAAFAVFPNGGRAVRVREITSVLDADGDTALANAVEAEQILSPQVAYQMVSMLTDVIDRRDRCAGQAQRDPLRCRRQDRHHERLQGRVVRRILLVDRRRRVGGLRSAADDRSRWLPRAIRAADLDGLHAAGIACAAARRVHPAGGASRRGIVRRVVPAASGRLSALRRALQGGR